MAGSAPVPSPRESPKVSDSSDVGAIKFREQIALGHVKAAADEAVLLGPRLFSVGMFAHKAILLPLETETQSQYY